MGTLKSGWLEKQGGGIFWKDWKQRHCVLYRDGELSIYEKTTNATAELRINMRLDCKRIDVGFDCGGTINLPKGRGDVEALFAIVGKHKTHIFLAPSESECRQWVGILENTRTSAAPPSKKVPMAPAQENIPPPAYSPMEYSQPLGAGSTAPPPPGVVPHGQPAYQPAPSAPGYYPQQGYGQPSYGQPMYGQPMYGQPMYGQPVYVSQAPQQQPQGNNNTRNMMLAGGGGLLGGYLLGSMMSESMHHHHSDYGGGGGGGGGFDGGGFDGGGFDF